MSNEEFQLFSGGKLKQFSPTMGSTIRRCQVQAGFRYIHGLKKPPQRFLVVGSSAHKAAEHGWTAIGGGTKTSPAEIGDVAVAEYERVVGETNAVIDYEGTDPVKAHSEDKQMLGRVMPEFWSQLGSSVRVSTDIPPESVIDVTMPGGYTLKAILDVVAEDKDHKLTIHDLKTAKKKWPAGKEAEELQSIYYPYALSAATSKPVIGMSYLVAAANKITPSIEDRRVEIRPETQRKIPMITDAFVAGYEALHRAGGLGVPAWSKMVCSWCGFRKECRDAFGVEPPGGGGESE